MEFIFCYLKKKNNIYKWGAIRMKVIWSREHNSIRQRNRWSNVTICAHTQREKECMCVMKWEDKMWGRWKCFKLMLIIIIIVIIIIIIIMTRWIFSIVWTSSCYLRSILIIYYLTNIPTIIISWNLIFFFFFSNFFIS